MKQRKLPLLFLLVLIAVAAVAISAVTAAAAKEVSIKYVDENGEEKTAEDIVDLSTAGTPETSWNNEWIAVSGTLTMQDVTVTGDVHLVLMDGCQFTVTASSPNNAAIQISENGTLTIYGQSAGTGVLYANGNNSPAIGSPNPLLSGISIAIYGGNVVATTDGSTALGTGTGDGLHLNYVRGTLKATAASTAFGFSGSIIAVAEDTAIRYGQSDSSLQTLSYSQTSAVGSLLSAAYDKNVIILTPAYFRVDGTKYATLNDAVTACGENESTIHQLRDYTAEKDGEIRIQETQYITLNLEGRLLNLNEGLIYNRGSFTIEDNYEDSAPTHTFTCEGGLYVLDPEGDITLEGGIVYNGEDTDSAIYNGGSLLIFGGNFVGNRGGDGAVIFHDGDQLEIYGGLITGNLSDDGAVDVEASGVKIGGDLQIYGNFDSAGQVKRNLVLENGEALTVRNAREHLKVGVTVWNDDHESSEGNVTVAYSDCTFNDAKYFVLDDSDLVLAFVADHIEALVPIEIDNLSSEAAKDENNGYLLADSGSVAGALVTVAAVPNDGYTFVSLNVTKKDDPSVTVPSVGDRFTMPEYAVCVEAVFAEAEVTVRAVTFVDDAASTKQEKTVSEDGKTVTSISFKYKNGAWVYQQKRVDVLNDDGLPIRVETYRYDNSAWKGLQKSEMTYDAEKRAASMTTYRYDEQIGDFTYSSKSEYSYGPDGKVSDKIEYAWLNDEWTNYVKYEYTYGETTHTETRYSWVGDPGQWQTSAKVVDEYDCFGNEIRSVYYVSAGIGFAEYEKTECVFDVNGNLLQSVDYVYDAEWIFESRETYTYDAYGFCSSFVNEDYVDSEWENQEKYTFKYDERGNEIERILYEYAEDEWVADRKYVSRYSATNQLISSEIHYCANESWSLKSKTVNYAQKKITSAGDVENGNVSAPETALYQDTVEVVLTPDEGCEVVKVVYNDGEEHEITVDEDGKYFFTMPDTAVTVSATFEKTEQTLFSEYKESEKARLDALLYSDDSNAVRAIVTNAKAAIDALVYDSTKTLADNESLVAAASTGVENDLEAQRNQDSFTAYRTAILSQIDALADSDDSDAVLKIITDAKTTADALSYDTTLTLTENVELLDEVLAKAKADVEAQRESEKGLGAGAIVAIVLGSIVGLALIVYAAGYFCYRGGHMAGTAFEKFYSFLPKVGNKSGKNVPKFVDFSTTVVTSVKRKKSKKRNNHAHRKSQVRKKR